MDKICWHGQVSTSPKPLRRILRSQAPWRRLICLLLPCWPMRWTQHSATSGAYFHSWIWSRMTILPVTSSSCYIFPCAAWYASFVDLSFSWVWSTILEYFVFGLFLKGAIMKHKSEVSPWLLQSPVFGSEKIMYLDCFFTFRICVPWSFYVHSLISCTMESMMGLEWNGLYVLEWNKMEWKNSWHATTWYVTWNAI